MARDENEYGVQSINRALALLKLFSTENPNLSLTEICQTTGLTMPTAHRMVKALRSNGFLVQDPFTGRLSLGPAVVRLAFVLLRNNDISSLVSFAMPYLGRLRSTTGETVGLHVPSEGGRLCVAEAVSRHLMLMATGVGNIMPWHAGAASKAMLAFMPEDERDHLLASTDLAPLTEATMVDAGQFRKALATVRKQGYAISEGESVPGASAIAKPILNANGRVIAAINITGPSTRWSRRLMIMALPNLSEATTAIESFLGRSPDQPVEGSAIKQTSRRRAE